MTEQRLVALAGLAVGVLVLGVTRWLRSIASEEQRAALKVSEVGLWLGFGGFQLATLLGWVNGGGAVMLLGAVLVLIGIARSGSNRR